MAIVTYSIIAMAVAAAMLATVRPDDAILGILALPVVASTAVALVALVAWGHPRQDAKRQDIALGLRSPDGEGWSESGEAFGGTQVGRARQERGLGS